MTGRMSAQQFRERFVEPTPVSAARVTLLDMPPSANGLRKSFIKEGKVVSVKSEAYATWRSAAVSAIKAQGVGRIVGPYHLSIVAQRNWRSKRPRDIDNLIKPLSDSIVKAGVVQDDSLTESIAARWDDDLQGYAVIIDIEVVR